MGQIIIKRLPIWLERSHNISCTFLFLRIQIHNTFKTKSTVSVKKLLLEYMTKWKYSDNSTQLRLNNLQRFDEYYKTIK